MRLYAEGYHATHVWHDATLGATPRRLLLLALGDALIVATAVLGVAIAHGVVTLVVAFTSTQLPRTDAIEVNGVTVAFAVCGRLRDCKLLFRLLVSCTQYS